MGITRRYVTKVCHPLFHSKGKLMKSIFMSCLIMTNNNKIEEYFFKRVRADEHEERNGYD